MKVSVLSRRHPRLTYLASFLLGALLVFGIQKVFADNTIYYACVKTNNGSIRMVDANTTCSSGETLISWNQTGPQGPQGIQGPPGPSGNSGFICVACKLKDVLFRLNRTDLVNVNLDSAQITGDLTNQDMSNSSFIHAVLGVNLSGSNLSNGNFTDAGLRTTLHDSNFTSANLTRTDLSGVDAANTNFTNATMINATFGGGGNLTNTNFTGANLTGAIDLDTTYQDGVIWSNTICPDGTNSDNDGNTCVGHLTP